MQQLKQTHSLWVRWHHWLNAPLLAVMIWSGVLIYWANQAYIKIPEEIALWRGHWIITWPWRLQIGPWVWEFHHRLAEGMAWHFAFGWLFALNGLVFAIYAWRSGHWRELLPDRRCWREAAAVIMAELRGREPVRRGKYNAAQRIVYTGVLLMGAGALATGLAIYKPWQLGWLSWLLGGYEAARLEHFLLTCGFLAFIILHVAQVIRAGWGNFRGMLTGYELAPAPESPPLAPEEEDDVRGPSLAEAD